MWLVWLLAGASVPLVAYLAYRMSRRAPEDPDAIRRALEIIDQIAAAVAVIEDGRVLHVNGAFRSTFRLDGAELERPLEELIRRSEEDEGPLDLLSDGDVEVVLPGGTRRIVHRSSARPIELDGRRLELVAFEDVTEERFAAATSERRDRLVTLGTLAASAMHEVKNPLASMMVNLDTATELTVEAVRRTGPARKPLIELAEILTEIRDDAERIGIVADDVGTMSAPQRETMAPTDLAECARVAARMMMPLLRRKAELVVEAERIPLVIAAEVRVRQMLINLLTNAAQAIDESSGLHRVVVRALWRDGAVLLEVEDDGPGIPPEIVDSVFDPLVTTKARGHGTGLGLYVVARLAEGMGAEVSLDTALGRGTKFTLRFTRLVPQTISGAIVLGPEHSEAPAGRLLIVDDRLSVINSLRRDLPTYEVTFARSGAEAIALLERRDFDLILLDMMMPGLTGRDVYRRVQKVKPEVLDRIIFMTGLACDDDLRTWAEEAGIHLVTKPFDTARTVSNALSRTARA